MIDNITPKKYEYNNLSVVYGLDTTIELMDKCIKQIDRVYYKDSTTDSELIKKLVFENPQFCFIIVDNETTDVVGYLYCFPTTEEVTLNFLKGNKTFKELKLEDMDPFRGEGLYNLFIASLALKKEYHTKSVRRMLFECFINQVIAMGKRDMFINYIYMELASDFEREVCKLFDIQKLTTNKVNREIYGGLFDLERFIKVDNYLAMFTLYDTEHANKFLRFRRDYTNRLTNLNDKKDK